MKRKGLAILVVSLVIIMNFFIIIQNQYIPQKTDNFGSSNKDIPGELPNLDEPSLQTADEQYPATPNEIDSSSQIEYLSDYYYRYKDFVFNNINDTLSFIFQNLLNTSDAGFYEYVNLTGGSNDTKKYTSTNALMVISLVDLYLNNDSYNYLQKANETMEFMLQNLYYNFTGSGLLAGFVNYVENDGVTHSNLLNCSDNALAILALLKMYQVTLNTTFLTIANQTLTYMNEELWDSEYSGYFRSNASTEINGSKFTLDNLFAAMANMEVYWTVAYDYEDQINAWIRAENIMENIIRGYSSNYGLTLNTSRNWSIATFANNTEVNAIGISSLLKYYEKERNETHLRLAENLSRYLQFNLYDSIFQGFNDSLTDTTKYLEANSWAIKALLELYDATQNVTYYILGRNVSYFINDYLWDSFNRIYNYSVDSGAAAQNWTIKDTRANSLAIQALLKFRFPRLYLTRANTTARLLLEHYRPDDVGFYKTLQRDNSPTGSQFELTTDDLLALTSLCELGLETNHTFYITNTSNDIWDRINSTFYNSTEGSFKIGLDDDGDLINQSTLVDNAYAILALSELYKTTNDMTYLDVINKTWYYINSSLWDSNNGGYLNRSTGQINRNSFDQFLMILANLEVASVSTYPDLQANATFMANYTLQFINNKMWDNVSGGYYSTANTTWSVDSQNQNKADAKKLDVNSLAIMTQLKYLELFPTDVNVSTYSNRTNQTLNFMENYLWDNELGGFFDFCNHNGSSVALNKSTTDNCWAILAYCKFYNKTNNYTYYSKAEEVMSFINLYLWDYDNGGFFTGYYNQEVGDRAIKTPKSEFMVIRALVALSNIRNRLSIAPLMNIIFDESKLSSLGRYVYADVFIYDTDGNKLDSASAFISLSGFQDNIGFSPVYGLGQTFNFTAKTSNIYNFTLNVSPYYGRIYVNPRVINESYGIQWQLFLLNRTFSTYISRAFSVISSLTAESYDNDNYGFYVKDGTNLNKSTEDNFFAITAISEFISSTGLNLAINWKEYAFDQIMINFSIDTLNFLLNNFSVGNSTFRGFVAQGNYNGSWVANLTLCKDNAWAILALTDLYELTQNITYLDIANATWLYLNNTFWDSNNYGYNATNATQQTKYLYDNLLAIMANLAIANNSYFNPTIRNKASELANFTLNETVSKLWDTEINGFFNTFNYNWLPLRTIDEKSTTENALAILTLIKYLEMYPNDVNNDTYSEKLNQTADFMLEYLWDSGYLGFFSYYNGTVGITDTNKTLNDNSFAILAYSELYEYTRNYTHYITAEKATFFLNTYFWNPNLIAGSYVNKSSIFGSVETSNNLDTFSSLSIAKALIKLSTIRLNLENPPVVSNFTVGAKIEGKIEDLYDIKIEIFDGNGIPLQGSTAFAIVYSKDQIFNFSTISGNDYDVTVNVSRLSRTIQINMLIFNESRFAAGSYTFQFNREFPIYIQMAQDSLNYLMDNFWNGTYQLWNATHDGFFYSQFDISKYSYDNFLMMDAISSLNQTLGPIIYSFNWDANDTFDKYVDRVYDFLDNVLRVSSVYINNSIVNQTVFGFVERSSNDLQVVQNLTQLKDNAIAVISLLDLYEQTNNPVYLKMANETWLYLNATFWDNTNGGYMSTNRTNANITRDVFDNFLAILAALKINQTVSINSTIRENAFHMANETFILFNTTQNVWDPNTTQKGGYFDTVNITESGYWNTTMSNKSTSANALGILALLEFHKITGNNSYLDQAKYLANLMIQYLWDVNDTGFYNLVRANWSLPVPNNKVIKYALSNAWAFIAFYELFNFTSNFTIYTQAENIITYLSSFFLNFQYVNDQIYFLGFRETVNKSNYAGGYSVIESNAMLIKALVNYFDLINSTFWTDITTPWLTDSTTFVPGTDPPNGEIMNATLYITYNSSVNQTNANVKLNIIGYESVSGIGYQRFIYRINATFNSSGNNLYIGEFINLTLAEDIYLCILGINSSSPALFNVYHVTRLKTSLEFSFFTGIPVSPIAIKNKHLLPDIPYWNGDGYRWKQYILGEDRITINATYGSEESILGHPYTLIENGRVNFVVLRPDGTLWINRTVLTTENGVGTISFGPTPLLDDAVGIYNVTITAERGPSSTTPKTWYASATAKIYIQVGYGIYVVNFSSITSNVAQGDLLQCNLTLKNDRKTPAYINITAHGSVFIENSSLINYLVGVGYSKEVLLVKVDERTIPGIIYTLTSSLIFQEKYIDNETLSVPVIPSTSPTKMGIPIQIAESDTRYAIFKVKNQKLLVNLNFSLEVFCPEALNHVKLNQTLSQNVESYFYVPLTVKDDVPYGQFSGEIKVSWVNYSQDFSFTIRVTPDLGIGTIVTPLTPYQDQSTLLTVEIENYKSSPVQVVVGVVGTGGFQPTFISSFIGSFSSAVVAVPCVFNPLPWQIGTSYLQIQVYILSEKGLELKYSRVFMTTVIMSIPNIILLYFVPLISITLIMILILNRIRKIKEVEKKKLVSETPGKKKEDEKNSSSEKRKREKAPSPL